MLSKMNYRIEDLTANQSERALLPAHPAGLIELTDVELDAAAGGFVPLIVGAAFAIAYFAGMGEAW